MRLTTQATAAPKAVGEGLLWIRDARLLRGWACTRVELLAIFECLSALLIQPLLRGKHIDHKVDFFPDSRSTIHSIFIVAEVA